jgi:hypothetical protein
MASAKRTTPGGYRWNAQLQRYVAPNGRIVSADQVRREIDVAMRGASARARDLTTQLRGRTITLPQWEAAMRVVVKDVHLWGASAARGGWAQLTPADLGRVGARVRQQYDRLYRFANQIAQGTQALDGYALNRAAMYANQGRAMYERTRTASMRDAGFDQERNVLHPADHCDMCVAQSKRGWVAIGTLVPVGERTCRSNCRCTLRYRMSPAAKRAAAEARKKVSAETRARKETTRKTTRSRASRRTAR